MSNPSPLQARSPSGPESAGTIRPSASFTAHLKGLERKIPLRARYENFIGAAFRLMCSYGATTSHRSDRVWPLVDDAIRCYHGDAEFPAMLTSLIAMVTANAADSVKIAAADRMLFDAENAKGLLKRRASSIVAAAPKRRAKKKVVAPEA